MQGTQVQSLVRELKSYMPYCVSLSVVSNSLPWCPSWPNFGFLSPHYILVTWDALTMPSTPKHWWPSILLHTSPDFSFEPSTHIQTDLIDYSVPGSSVHGILQARILEWVAISFSRGSSQPRDQNHISYVSCIGCMLCGTCEKKKKRNQWEKESFMEMGLDFKSESTEQDINGLEIPCTRVWEGGSMFIKWGTKERFTMSMLPCDAGQWGKSTDKIYLLKYIVNLHYCV